jgi:photosystem II stability/assembly factor-like uncharacterized protein
MKNAIILISLLFALTAWAQKQARWTSLGMTAPDSQIVHTLSVVDDQVIWGGCTYPHFVGNQVFRTADGGQNFSTFRLPTTSPFAFIYQVLGLNADTAYVVVGTENGNAVEGVYRTRDGGTTWSLVFDCASWGVPVFQMHFFDASDGVIMGNALGSFVYSMFFYTTDGGDTWTQSTGTFQSSCLFLESAGKLYDAVGDSIWYAGGVKNLIYRSVDRGQTWTSHSLPPNSNLSVQDLAFRDPLNGLALASFSCNVGDTENFLYYTSDGGTTWAYRQTIKHYASTAEANNLEYIPGTLGTYLTTSGLLPGNSQGFMTVNNGMSWHFMDAPSVLYEIDFIHSESGFAGGPIAEGGLFRFDDQIDSIATSLKPLSYEVGGLTLFPNPNHGSFHLHMQNDWRGELKFRLYNLQGQQLLAFDRFKSEAEARWEVSLPALPAGRYQL